MRAVPICPITPTTTVQGTLYTTTNGTWSGSPAPTFTRQWKSDAANVGTGLTTYTTVAGDRDQDHYLRGDGDQHSRVGQRDVEQCWAGDGGAGGSTWNPSDATANMELSGGNLTAQTDDTAGFAWQGVRGTASHANGSGKWYFEITIVDGGDFVASESLMMIGLCDATYSIGAGGSGPGAVDDKGFTYRVNTSGFASAQTNTVFYPSGGYAEHTEGDVIGIACDMSGASPKVWIRDNGTWEEGDPVAGTLGLDIGATAGALFPFVLMQWQAVSPITVTLRTTATFAATPPTGFTAWGSTMPEFDDYFPTARYGTNAINVMNFGAFGDNTGHTMGELFPGDLTAAQAAYPSATSLNDTADWCAITEAFKAAFTTGGTPHGSATNLNKPVCFPAGQYVVRKPLIWQGIAGAHIYGLGGMGGVYITNDNTAGTPAERIAVRCNGLRHSRIEGITFKVWVRGRATRSISTRIIAPSRWCRPTAMFLSIVVSAPLAGSGAASATV